jgi:BlaI family penicillinase repressor
MSLTKLTPVEWEIMEAVWELGGSPSVREVLDHAFTNGEKAYTTVQTMMNILVKKGMLKPEKKGLVNFYRPVYNRSEVVRDEMSQMISRVFNGSVPAMANYLFRMKDLSRDEIETIKGLLDGKAAGERK